MFSTEKFSDVLELSNAKKKLLLLICNFYCLRNVINGVKYRICHNKLLLGIERNARSEILKLSNFAL